MQMIKIKSGYIWYKNLTAICDRVRFTPKTFLSVVGIFLLLPSLNLHFYTLSEGKTKNEYIAEQITEEEWD
jgi:hypothetical protein